MTALERLCLLASVLLTSNGFYYVRITFVTSVQTLKDNQIAVCVKTSCPNQISTGKLKGIQKNGNKNKN